MILVMKIITTILLLFSACFLSAQITFYSNTSTTNFNTLSGWSANTNGTGANPVALNNTITLIIQSAHSKTTSAAATINRLTIENGGTVTANNAITVGGTTPQFNINNGGTYVHNNTGTLSSTIFTGTENFGATSTFQINNWQNLTTEITPASSLLASAVGFDGLNYYYGNLIINWAIGATAWEQGWTGTVNLTAGNFTINNAFNGSFLFSPNTGPGVTPNIYVAGNFLMNGIGTINFTDKNQVSYLNINGNFEQNSGILTTSGAPASGSIGTIRTYGTGTSEWRINGGTRALINYRTALQFGALSKTVVLKTDFNLGVTASGFGFAQIFNVDAGTTFDAEDHTITCGYTTQFATSGTIRTSNTNGLVGSTITTLSNSPTVQWGIGTNCTAVYYATGSQTVSAVPIYENVTILNSGTKNLAGDATVYKTFNFSGAGNYLNMGSNNFTITSTGSISNASNTSYFISNPTTGTNGRLRQNALAVAAKLFPIGTATNYLPVTITPTSTGSDFSLNVFRSTTTNGLPTGSGFNPRNMQADAVYWIDRVVGSGNAQIRFDWQTNAIEGSVFTTLPTSPNKIGIWRLVTGTWVLANGALSTNYIADNTSNFVYTNGALTTFGTTGTGYPYIVANIDILPLRITNLKATKINSDVLLNWHLASIDQITHFEVQKSKEGRNFTSIATIYTTDKISYTFTDVDLSEGTNYYRIKVFDAVGEITFSYIVAVGNKLKATVEFYNNPVQAQLLFKHPAAVNATYKIIDVSGRQVKAGRIPTNAVVSQIDLSSLTPGQYVLQFFNENETVSKQFIKQ